jgi:hypothetical protein
MTDPVAGQDVEAQARALTRPRRASRFAVVVAGFAGATDDPAEALAWLQEWPAASLYVPLRAVEAAREDERSALRAAQAEAERRYTALKAECDADHPPEPWASELQAKLDAAERRAQEAEAQLGRVPAIIHAVLDEAGAERHGEVEPERYGIPPGTKHGSKGWRSMTRGRGTWKWRILRLGKAAARAAAHP